MVLFVILLLLQLALKTVLEKMFLMVLAIQIAQNYSLYGRSSQLPANLNMLLGYVRDVIEFKYMKADQLYKQGIIPQSEFLDSIFLKQEKLTVDVGVEDASLFSNVSQFVMAAGVALVALMVMGLISLVVWKARAKIKALLVKQKKKFFMNGFLRTYYIGYINFCIGWSAYFYGRFEEQVKAQALGQDL